MDKDIINNRENKGINDIISTETSQNGVFEIDEKFANGYHLYVPYGIHSDLHNAISFSVRQIQNLISEIEDIRKKYDINKPESKIFIEEIGYDIDKYKSYIKVLTALNELENDV